MKFYKFMSLRVAKMLLNNLSLRATEVQNLNDEYELYPDTINDNEIISLCSSEIKRLAKEGKSELIIKNKYIDSIDISAERLIEICKQNKIKLSSDEERHLNIEKEANRNNIKSGSPFTKEKTNVILLCLLKGIDLSELIGDSRRAFVRQYASHKFLVISGTDTQSNFRHFIKEGYCSEVIEENGVEKIQPGVYLKMEINRKYESIADQFTVRKVSYVNNGHAIEYSNEDPYSKLKERFFYKLKAGINTWNGNKTTIWEKEREVRILIDVMKSSENLVKSNNIRLFPLSLLIDLRSYIDSGFRDNIIKFFPIRTGGGDALRNSMNIVDILNCKVAARSKTITTLIHHGDKGVLECRRNYREYTDNEQFKSFIDDICDYDIDKLTLDFDKNVFLVKYDSYFYTWGSLGKRQVNFEFTENDLNLYLKYLQDIEILGKNAYFSELEAIKTNKLLEKIFSICEPSKTAVDQFNKSMKSKLGFRWVNLSKPIFGLSLNPTKQGFDVACFDLLCKDDLSIISKYFSDYDLTAGSLSYGLKYLVKEGLFSDIHHDLCKSLINKNPAYYESMISISSEKSFTDSMNESMHNHIAEGRLFSYLYKNKVVCRLEDQSVLRFDVVKNLIDALESTSLRNINNNHLKTRLSVMKSIVNNRQRKFEVSMSR